MGRSFGRYEIQAKIAAGGMAEVYLATHKGPGGFERKVALKQILPNFAEDPEFVGMFLDEARIAASLSHPNICQLFDFGCEEGRYYMAFEYVPGPTLAQLFDTRRPSLPPLLGAYVVARAAEGLAYAHEKADDHGAPLGIVHRDVSPQNLLVSPNGQVKIVDFGIARAVDRHVQTRTGKLRGKVGYMSPEQIEGKPLDGRSDVFTLGILLYEALTGRPLFLAETPLQAMRQVLRGEIPPLPQDPGVPEAVRAVTMKALARKVEDRMPSARELARQLGDALLAVRPRPDAEALARHVQSLPTSSEAATPSASSLVATEKEILIPRIPGAKGDTRSPPRVGRFSDEPIRITRRMSLVMPPDLPEATTREAAITGEDLTSGGQRVTVEAMAAMSGEDTDSLELPRGSLNPSRTTEEAIPEPPRPARPSNPALHESQRLSKRALAAERPEPSSAPLTESQRLKLATDAAITEPQRMARRSADARPTELEAPSGEPPRPSRVRPATPRPPEAKPGWRSAMWILPALFIIAAVAFGGYLVFRDASPGPDTSVADGPIPIPVSSPENGEKRLPSVTGYGRLSLQTSPRTDVFLDGVHLGATPLVEVRVPVGHQRLRVVNTSANIDSFIEVDIQLGHLTTQDVPLVAPHR